MGSGQQAVGSGQWAAAVERLSRDANPRLRPRCRRPLPGRLGSCAPQPREEQPSAQVPPKCMLASVTQGPHDGHLQPTFPAEGPWVGLTRHQGPLVSSLVEQTDLPLPKPETASVPTEWQRWQVPCQPRARPCGCTTHRGLLGNWRLLPRQLLLS